MGGVLLGTLSDSLVLDAFLFLRCPNATVSLQAGKLGIFYFLSTSLIIFPTALGGGLLGTFGAIRYLRNRTHIDSFDTAAVRRSFLWLFFVNAEADFAPCGTFAIRPTSTASRQQR